MFQKAHQLAGQQDELLHLLPDGAVHDLGNHRDQDGGRGPEDASYYCGLSNNASCTMIFTFRLTATQNH